ncbi:MAG: chemotaxis protein CheB [Reyranella sp.]|nr:chemotaxis protein CheB [Reyranella sp.]MDP3158997.1 chemotaxis protein CheB [Reyranella sp.]
MVAHAVIVVGVSTGGLEPLRRIIEALPRNCGASVFVVMHSGVSPSILPEILGWHGRVSVSFAEDGESIEAAHVYVAPPDHHMVVDSDRIRLNQGPKVHATRPAADPLFISAANAHGNRVVGVVLSGEGVDGAAGLVAIKAAGGCALVEDPRDAPVPSMPAAAVAADSPESLHIDALVDRVAEFCSLVHSGRAVDLSLLDQAALP